jgi:hypothetical protein
MSRFRDELRVIPIVAWILASIIGLVMGAAAVGVRLIGQPLGFAEFFLIIPIAIFLVIYVLLAGYVYGDARRRGMRYVVWTLLAIFVPYGIGILLYFLLREPITRPCPSCGALHKAGLAYCPNCGAAVGRVCAQCSRPAEESWRNCGHCGAALAG